jgi:stage V sporulation protein B
MVRGSARGSLVLMIGQIIATIINAVTVIWIARVLGSTSYGEYTIAFIPVSISLLFQDLGMNSSITRFVSLYRHDGQEKQLKTAVMTGLVFSIFTSIIISGFIIVFAEPIAVGYLHKPEIEPLLRASALAVLGGGGLVTTLQAIFVGYEIMSLRSFLTVFWSICRTVLSAALILMGMGSFGAVFAYTASQIIAGIIGVFLLLIYIKFPSDSNNALDFGMLKRYLIYGLPLSLGTLLQGILQQFYQYLMVLYVSTELIGNYGAAVTFGSLVSLLTGPIYISLFPLYSKFKRGDPELAIIFRTAVKFTGLITLPVCLAIIAVAEPLSRLMFGANDYPLVPLYLSVYILNYAFEGLGGMSLGTLISGIGESRASLRASIITFITGVSLAVLLVSRLGMVGILITIVLDSRGGWVYNTLWVKRNLGITIDWKSSIRIYLVAFIAFVVSYVVTTYSSLHGVFAVGVGGFAFFIVYFVGIVLSGALKRSDLRIIENMFKVGGPIASISNRVFSLIYEYARD